MIPMTFEGYVLTYNPFATYGKRYIGLSVRHTLRAASLIELCLLIEAHHG